MSVVDAAQGTSAHFQSDGAAVLVDEQGVICHVTDGCDDLLGVPPTSLVGTRLPALLPRPSFDELAAAAGEEPTWHLAALADGSEIRVRRFEAAPGLTGLDILPAGGQAPAVESATVERITRWTARLQAARSHDELMQVASSVASSLSGYEGVWAVRVEPDGNGFVEAVTVSGDAPDTTGSVVSAIHLPPGDLVAGERPAPFFVADVAEPPNELTPVCAQLLDLDGSALHRPFGGYLDFLSSIGVRSTFAIPVVADGTTWGRLIGHHPTPRGLSAARQSELRLVGIAAGVQLQELLAREAAAQRLALAVASAKVLRTVAASPSLAEGLRGAPEALLELCGASSAVVAIDDETAVLGEDLPAELVTAVLADARVKFASHDRAVVATSTMPFATVGHAGGYLAMRLDEAATDLVVWVRPERQRTVQWVAIASDGGGTPRLADAVRQVDRPEASSSEPWTAPQMQAVELFRAEIASVILARYGPLQQDNVDLRRSNTEFDAFAHTIAHDLRAPIRGIRQYVEFVLEDAAPRLLPTDASQLETVLRLTDRGTALLDDLMRYAQLGKATWTTETIDLRAAVGEAVEQLDRSELAGADIEVAEGTITADRSALRQLLVNLIGNAVKYSDGPAHVQIGLRTLAEVRTVSDPPPLVRELPDHTPVLCVEDEGVGIAREHLPRVFGLFRRANESLPHVAGTGAGLAMCRRIAQRHGGDIWLTSAPGQGTTVFTVLTP